MSSGARIDLDGREVRIDLSRPVSLAIDVDFSGRGPRHFGAPPARSEPFAAPGFSGEVATGASCNCRSITLIPHCNGTHTECVGHLTREPVDAHRVMPPGFVPALIVSVEPVAASETSESTLPAPQAGDRLITRQSLQRAWRKDAPFAPRALVIRTLPNDLGKLRRDYSSLDAPYLTREAAQWLVERGIEHLVVDLPSIDRSHDEGRLTAHRIFFGLEPDGRDAAQARRASCTITELAFVPDEAADGGWMLQLQAPALGGDAVPSRPLLYPVSSS